MNEVFEHYDYASADELVGSPFPAETRRALRKYLGSPIGRKIAYQAVGTGRKIRLGHLSYDGAPLAFFRNVEGDNNTISYTLRLSEFRASIGATIAEVGTLDIVFAHEIGHTGIAAAALGIPLHSWTYSQSGEFQTVRRFENPYRNYVGAPLRTTYGGQTIPAPLIEE